MPSPDIAHASWRGRVPVWREVRASPLPAAAERKACIAIVGAGPVGLALAIDIGQRGHRVLVLSRFDFIAGGSRAICISKRSLEILDRLGCGDAVVEAGVAWNVGKTFWKDSAEPIYTFDTVPVKDQKRPGFINIQQYRLEDILLQRLKTLPNVDIRWGHEVVDVDRGTESVGLDITSAAGGYRIDAEWLIACDGSRSRVRALLDLEFEGRVFNDNFLIVDVRMAQERPSERWFWFDPPFNPGRSVLLHKQPDDLWRLDFQLGQDIDRKECLRPENIDHLIRCMLGPDVDYEREWHSLYTFQCGRLSRFVHGQVIFAGDSAHLVSPFGARGCNGGLADIDNLGWKLDLVLRGRAERDLLESYDYEAGFAANENILHSSRSTDFITPKSRSSLALRNAVLELARDRPFAREFVNSGRLSTAIACPDSPLSTADRDEWWEGPGPGSPAVDAPLGDGWLIDRLGEQFVLLCNGRFSSEENGVRHIDLSVEAKADTAIRRYDLKPGSSYLIRPDQHVAARFRTLTPSTLSAALNRARGKAGPCR